MQRFLPAFLAVLALLSLLSQPALAARRAALVIGNGGYRDSPLRNPVNDATDVAAALRGLGFDVVLATDADKRTMVERVADFGRKAQGAEVALFFYAGHGMQVGGVNYLIPVRAAVHGETDVEFEAMQADRVLAQMQQAGATVNVVILDACRDNPFRSFRSASRGLAVVRAVTGSVVVYATAPGDVAADGSGRNSPFTASLLRNIATPGMPVDDMFQRIGKDVATSTKGRQSPWISSSLYDDYYLAGGGGRAAPPAPDLSADRARVEAERAALEAERKKLEAERMRLAQQPVVAAVAPRTVPTSAPPAKAQRAAPSASIPGGPTIRMRFSHVTAENTPKGRMAMRFKKLVEQRLGNRVNVEVFPAAQLFGDNKVLDAMRLGDIELAAPASQHLIKDCPAFKLFDLPFLFRDTADLERFESGPGGRALLESLDGKGLVGLGFLHNGMKQMSARRALRVPADAKDLRFRIMVSDVLEDQFAALGATGLRAPFVEVYPMLQREILDGQENTWSNILRARFHELQPYITETNHAPLEYVVMVSASFWRSLPEPIRDELAWAMDQALAYGNELDAQEQADARRKISESGRSTILSLDPARRQEWVRAVRPVWDKYRSVVGDAIFGEAVLAGQ